jgi:hypothetical protein
MVSLLFLVLSDFGLSSLEEEVSNGESPFFTKQHRTMLINRNIFLMDILKNPRHAGHLGHIQTQIMMGRSNLNAD